MELLSYTGSFLVNHAPELVGVILPPVIDYLNKDVKKDQERFLVSVVVCFLIAVLFKWEHLAYGSLDEVMASFGLIFAESQLVFKLYFKDSFFREKLLDTFDDSDTTTPSPMPESDGIAVNTDKLPQ